MRNLAVVAAFGTALLTSLASRVALAAPSEAILLPTAMPTKAEPGLSAEDAEQLSKLSRQLDAILSEAVQDLGLTLTVSNRTRVLPTDDALVERARDSWLISPRMSLEGSGVRLHIVAVAPGENVLRERTQHVDMQALEIRANLMMRDVVHSARPSSAPGGPTAPAPEPTVESEAPRSQGRAVLALNAAVVGGYVGFSLQRASGSSDPRLTYPLVALGTGIGLGASMLVADEWDITLGDAWFLSAGAWWPIASGVLIAKSYEVQKEDLYVYGLVAASAGVSLSVAALSLKPMSEGGALLAHSGGAAGTLLGGLTQMAAEGKTDITPERGMGYGAGIGVITAGVLATQVKVTSSRMLLIDLAASLGALTGAAAASPLLLVDESEDPTRNRVWLASIAAGTVVGGAIGWFSTRGAPVKDEKPLLAMPYFNMEPANPLRGTRSFMSLGLQGVW